MYIKQLLEKACINHNYELYNHQVNSLKDDSKSVLENDVFFAIKGVQVDGKDFILDAINNGAKTIIYEGEIKKEFYHINYIKVINIKRVLALFCKIYYKDLTKKVKIIGVTGTNGKTTISTLLLDYLSYSGNDCLLIGTNGIYFKDEHYYTSNTTLNILHTYTVLNEAVKKGAKYLIMEISSIGIREARVLYFDFDIVILTNITHDHLDYHKNITDYKFSKAYLLWSVENHPKKAVVINADDENFNFLASLVKAKLITYSIKNDSDFKAININKNLYNSQFQVYVKNNRYNIKSSLVGGFNIYNILAVLATIDFLNEDILSFIEFLRIYVSISGRMNKIFYKNRTIIVDFAHTPSSVLNVLSSLKEFTNHKITVVIGCGGNRDTSKRGIIADIALKYADKVIFTTDNPRDEDPEEIVNDMIKGISYGNYEVILDRKNAIISALDNSHFDEVIAILGKGCERSQIVNGIKYPFSDKEVVYNWIDKNSSQD